MYRLWSNRLARQGIVQFIAVFLLSQVESVCLPLTAYQRQQESREYDLSLIERLIVRQVPYYYYGEYLAVFEEQETSGAALDGWEADSLVTDDGDVTETPSVTDAEQGATQDALQSGYLEQMLRENTQHLETGDENNAEATGADTEGLQSSAEQSEEVTGNGEVGVMTEAGTETETEWDATADFVIPFEPSYTYQWEQPWTEDDLRSEFFAVDSSTGMKEEYLDAEALMSRDLTVKDTLHEGAEADEDEGQGAEDSSAKPQILIYHTHASEAFADSVPGDPSTTIVGAGDRLATLLEGYGFCVLHHTGVYDTERDVAYDKALPALTKLLEDNPSIEVVIDLHRDEMAEDRRLVMDLQGRPTARFMFFNGMSYLRKKGDIAYLENPYIMDNLAFSFQAQVLANEYYPGLTRKIYLKAYRYNMHLCPKSMLIELGAQNNTVEEIMNACDPLAHVLAMTLKKL